MSRKLTSPSFWSSPAARELTPQAILYTGSLASWKHFSLVGERILGAQSRIFDMALTITWIIGNVMVHAKLVLSSYSVALGMVDRYRRRRSWPDVGQEQIQQGFCFRLNHDKQLKVNYKMVICRIWDVLHVEASFQNLVCTHVCLDFHSETPFHRKSLYPAQSLSMSEFLTKPSRYVIYVSGRTVG
jgi:hypothetical protein